jgi:hypothetical protein
MTSGEDYCVGEGLANLVIGGKCAPGHFYVISLWEPRLQPRQGKYTGRSKNNFGAISG